MMLQTVRLEAERCVAFPDVRLKADSTWFRGRYVVCVSSFSRTSRIFGRGTTFPHAALGRVAIEDIVLRQVRTIASGTPTYRTMTPLSAAASRTDTLSSITSRSTAAPISFERRPEPAPAWQHDRHLCVRRSVRWIFGSRCPSFDTMKSPRAPSCPPR